MAWKPITKYRIAAAFTLINLVGGAYAIGAGEVMHAATHGVLAIIGGVWALRALRRLGPATQDDDVDAIESEDRGATRVENLAAEVDSLRQQLSETQERLDFAERMLARPDKTRHDQR